MSFMTNLMILSEVNDPIFMTTPIVIIVVSELRDHITKTHIYLEYVVKAHILNTIQVIYCN